MRWLLITFLVLVGSFTRAETVVTVKTVRANTLLTASDLTIKPESVSGGISDVSLVIGMEARVVLYAGRPIKEEHLTEPAIVQRNEIVPLVFEQSGLSISTNGRALDRGAVGDMIRVMNLASRTTLFGKVLSNGAIDVTRH
ncbi:MAG: flagellar basal body P-ring formation chaperone FlgA [Aliishimia sp.]